MNVVSGHFRNKLTLDQTVARSSPAGRATIISFIYNDISTISFAHFKWGFIYAATSLPLLGLVTTHVPSCDGAGGFVPMSMNEEPNGNPRTISNARVRVLHPQPTKVE